MPGELSLGLGERSRKARQEPTLRVSRSNLTHTRLRYAVHCIDEPVRHPLGNGFEQCLNFANQTCGFRLRHYCANTHR